MGSGTRDDVRIRLLELLVKNREETTKHGGPGGFENLVRLAATHPLVDATSCAAIEPGGRGASRDTGLINQPSSVSLSGKSDSDDVVIRALRPYLA